jgi:hypothetical protein
MAGLAVIPVFNPTAIHDSQNNSGPAGVVLLSGAEMPHDPTLETGAFRPHTNNRTIPDYCLFVPFFFLGARSLSSSSGEGGVKTGDFGFAEVSGVVSP